MVSKETMTPECPNCKTKKTLYKLRNDDGTHIVCCTNCTWKTGTLDNHIKLDHLPTLKDLKDTWR